VRASLLSADGDATIRCARDVLGDRRGELHEFAARIFEREAMLVISAHGYGLTPGCFGRPSTSIVCAHQARGEPYVSRHPLFDGSDSPPDISVLAQFDNFAKQ